MQAEAHSARAEQLGRGPCSLVATAALCVLLRARAQWACLACSRACWLVGPCTLTCLAQRADNSDALRIRDLIYFRYIIYRFVYDESPSYDTIYSCRPAYEYSRYDIRFRQRSYRIIRFQLIPEKLLNEFPIHLIRWSVTCHWCDLVGSVKSKLWVQYPLELTDRKHCSS